MKRFFISFSNEDIALAKFIRAYFSDLFQGNAQFFLSESIEPSKKWLNMVREEVKAADAGMFVLTAMSVYRPWLNIELGALWTWDKEIYPMIAGELRITDIHRPLTDFETTQLTDEASVSKLIRQISSFCGLAVPPLYNAKNFCEGVQARIAPVVAFTDMAKVSDKLGLIKPSISETLKDAMIDSEPDDLAVQVLRGDTLSVSGKLSDSGIVSLRFSSSEAIEYMVLEINNAENIQKCFEGRMAKIIMNHEPLLAFKNQRHPFDPQYIPKQNGFFVFSLMEFPTDQNFTIKIIFWRTYMQHLLFRLYFIRRELMAQADRAKAQLLTS